MATSKSRKKTAPKKAISNVVTGGIKSKLTTKPRLLRVLAIVVIVIVGYLGWHMYQNHQYAITKAAAGSWTKLTSAHFNYRIGGCYQTAPFGSECSHGINCPTTPATGFCSVQSGTINFYACKADASTMRLYVFSTYKFPSNKSTASTALVLYPATKYTNNVLNTNGKVVELSNKWWNGNLQQYKITMSSSSANLLIRPWFVSGDLINQNVQALGFPSFNTLSSC